MTIESKSQVPKATSYADALILGRKNHGGDGAASTYGAKVKAEFPKVAFSENPPKFLVDQDGKKVLISPTKEEEMDLVTPFKWVLRGSFLRRRPSIKAIDEEIHKTLKPQDQIQVAATAETEVLIRCSTENDFIKILSRNSIRIGETQMRIFRWCPTKTPNRSLAAIWFSIKSLPLHLSSPECLRKMLQPWGTLLAVHDDVKYLTRPEEALVCIEVNFNHQWPSELVINSYYGTFVSPVKVLHMPKWCRSCGLMGHVSENCRKKKLICAFCNKIGHEASKCRSLYGKESKQIGSQNASNSGNPMYCSKCKNLGYEFCRCPLGRVEQKIGNAAAGQWIKIPSGRTRNSEDGENHATHTKTPKMDKNDGRLKNPQMQHSKEHGEPKEQGESSNKMSDPKEKDVNTKIHETKVSGNSTKNVESATSPAGLKGQGRFDKDMKPNLPEKRSSQITAVENGGCECNENVSSNKNLEGNSSQAGVSTQENKDTYIATSKMGETSPAAAEFMPNAPPAAGNIMPTTSEDNDQKDLPSMDPSSPAASEIQITPFKPWGPMLWSSMAGDIHLNYAMCSEKTVRNIIAGTPYERRPSISTPDFDKPLPGSQPKIADPKFKCSKCEISLVEHKGNMCKICNFKGSKRKHRKKASHSPPKYTAKSDECFFTKSKADQWETDAKKELLDVAATELELIKKAAAKARQPSPTPKVPSVSNKVRWGDLSSEEDSLSEDYHSSHEIPGKDEENDGPKGRGTKIKSRINIPKEMEPRKTRSGKSTEYNEEQSREKWIEGIRLLKVKHYDQRHNATWFKWEVAPGVEISRKKKKRIEDIAQRSGSS